MLAYLKSNRDVLSAFIKNLPGVHMAPMEATYLAWLDMRELGLAPEKLGIHLENHGIGLSDGRDFGAPGFMRLNFGCTRRILDAGMERMKQAIDAI